MLVLEKLFIASHYRQLSAVTETKKYKIKTSFVSPVRPMAQLNEIGINLMSFIYIFVENYL